MENLLVILLIVIGGILFLIIFFPSIKNIGPTDVGLVMKRFGRKLPDDNPIAFHGEAGYQAKLLMPGFRFKLWLLYRVRKFPWVQVPAFEIGVVISQIGKALPSGAKSAKYKDEFGDFTNLKTFVDNGGEKGVQRPVLPSGSLLPIHPIAFLVITKKKVYGLPISPELQGRDLGLNSFNLESKDLDVVRIEPKESQQKGDKGTDVVGVVTILEGPPLASGHIASRLGGFSDIEKLEADEGVDDLKLIDVLLGDKNGSHNNYQNFQKFLDEGGEMGLQHDVLRYGAYNLNPFLVKVEIVPMLVVDQGETATIKAYVGLSTKDTSGTDFKFGSLVRPGHRGLWRDSLRTGKYAINPRIYQAEIVPTAIIKLDWAKDVSSAHGLDKQLSPIVAKSNEGFEFTLDLQVLIHVPDTKAPKVISMVGTMQNLVNEVLQAAVGNFFRDQFGSMKAIKFIETRQQVQEQAFKHIEEQLKLYDVETRGVYIQDVVLPPTLVTVLNQREIASQEIITYGKQKEAQDKRIDMEKSTGMADTQRALATSQVGITIKENNAKARTAEGGGEASYISQTGLAEAAVVKAKGQASGEGYRTQVEALGQGPTAIVNAIKALAESKNPIMPNILVVGGSGGGTLDGLMATLMDMFQKKPASTPASVIEKEDESGKHETPGENKEDKSKKPSESPEETKEIIQEKESDSEKTSVKSSGKKKGKGRYIDDDISQQ